MKYFKLSNPILLFFAMIIFFGISSCKKVKELDSLGDAGQTIVKLLGGDDPASTVTKSIEFVSTPISILAVEVRRDVPNNAELNKTMVVTVLDDTAAVTMANPALIHLNPAWYTIKTDGVKTGGEGGTYTLTFAPGQFSISIYIIITNPTLLDPSSLYGLGFTLLTADAGGKISTQKSLVVEIGAKNNYDGIYSYESGNVQRYTAPGVPEVGGLNGSLAGNPDIFMITTGANSVNIPPPGPGGLFWAFGSGSQVAGIDGLRVTVDPVTNLVTMTSAQNASLTNWAGHINDYNPATRTFRLAFRWNPTANVREYEVVFKWKSPR